MCAHPGLQEVGGADAACVIDGHVQLKAACQLQLQHRDACVCNQLAAAHAHPLVCHPLHLSQVACNHLLASPVVPTTSTICWLAQTCAHQHTTCTVVVSRVAVVHSLKSACSQSQHNQHASSLRPGRRWRHMQAAIMHQQTANSARGALDGHLLGPARVFWAYAAKSSSM